MPDYSACGDLPHALWDFLGLRNYTINRAPGWRCGKNIQLLAQWEGVALSARGIDWSRGDGGDVLLVRSQPAGVEMPRDDSHVMVVLSCHLDRGIVTVAHYGQPYPMIGRQATLPIRTATGHRPWQLWLPLPRVLRACGIGGAP
jgi:hypothetical protein